MSIKSTAIALAVSLSMFPAAGSAQPGLYGSAESMGRSNGDLVEVYHKKGHRPQHCHRDIRRHYHNVFGRKAWHKHVGKRCRPALLRRFDYPRYYPGCIRVGPFWFCP